MSVKAFLKRENEDLRRKLLAAEAIVAERTDRALAREQKLAKAEALLREAVADPRCCCGCEWIARVKEAIDG